MMLGAFEDTYAYENLVKLIEQFDIKRIIETGTYLGKSTEIFCRLNLKVDSIEINESFFNGVKETLHYDNLSLHLGSSPDVLQRILSDGEDGLLFFLDAHWEPNPLPLLDELKIIADKRIKPVIIIHDFFVPAENGNAKFGYDTYRDHVLNFLFIKDAIDSIYDTGSYHYYYNEFIDKVDAGIIYIHKKV